MTLSAFTLSSLNEFVTGENGLTPYLTGPKIIALFNSVGLNDSYERGMPGGLSRNEYALEKLKEINGSKNLKVLLEFIFDARNFIKEPSLDLEKAVEKMNPLIQKDGYKLVNIADSFVIIGKGIPDAVNVDIHFEQIQSQIIEQIRKAKFLIWVAVGWFTDKTLGRELYLRKKDGLSICVITIDDEINNNNGKFVKEHLDAKRVPPKGKYENIMHHKFCIIDLNVVIHGSYNWTVKAQWNNETISIDTGREIAEKFAKEFINLNK